MSYILSLQMPETRMTGATLGYDLFGKTGVCPHCGSYESLLVYEYFPLEQISEVDVRAIRKYWQQQALTWWQSQQQRAGTCENCNEIIVWNQGYLSGNDLLCENCVNKGLMTEGLSRLKDNPHFYGRALLRKARRFRT